MTKYIEFHNSIVVNKKRKLQRVLRHFVQSLFFLENDVRKHQKAFLNFQSLIWLTLYMGV